MYAVKRWLLIALFTSSCLDVVEHGTTTGLTVVTTDCAGASVLEGATQLTISVSAARKLLFVRTVPVAEVPRSIGLPEATNAQLRVTATDGEGHVIAKGSSQHFDVGVTPGAVSVTLFPVDRFVKECASLTQARAFHTATQLLDGRVLFVGGLGRRGEPMSSMEVLGAGVMRGAGPLELTSQGNHIPLPRSHHAAVRADSGQVFISGGESPTPLATSVFVEPQQAFATGALRATSRSRHSVFKVGQTVVLLGGTSTEAVANPLIESLDLASFRFSTITTLPRPRLEAAVTVFGTMAFLVGGVDEQGASAEVQRVTVDAPFRFPLDLLITPRRSATVIGLGSRVLVIGGFGSDGALLGSTEWLTMDGSPHPAGPSVTPRARACAVPLPGLRALVIGGVDAAGPTAAAEIIDSTGTIEAIPFPGAAREGHACTVLDDGSVLVSAGLDHAGAPLDDLWRYTPSAN